jgi:predicted nucleotidyltransferase
MKLFLHNNLIIENYGTIGLPIQIAEIDELEEASANLNKTITQDLKIPKEIMSSFQVKPTLNPKFWDGDKLKPEIQQQMLKIAQDFFAELNTPPSIKIKDIIFTGSLANYNWSKFSDVDIHVIINYKEVNDNEEFTRQLLDAYKNLWNINHDLSINDFEVELYIQDNKSKIQANAIYSLLKNKWILKPEKEKVTINRNIIKTKALDFIEQLKSIKTDYKEQKYNNVISKTDKLLSKIKKYRQSGLESGGEFSIENLVYKVLRRTSFLDVLFDLKTKAYDEEMSLEEIQKKGAI